MYNGHSSVSALKTSEPSVCDLYQSLGASQRDSSTFSPSPCSVASLRPCDSLVCFRGGRGEEETPTAKRNTG